MEEKIELIKDNLTGDLDRDLEYLDSLYEEQKQILEDTKTTIEAINIVAQAINETKLEEVDVNQEENDEENNEEVYTQEQSEELDQMIQSFIDNVDNMTDKEAISNMEVITTNIEKLTVSDDEKMYCSFKNAFEKEMFIRVFADESKEVLDTPYSNDTIYVMYGDLLLNNKRYTSAMSAYDRAIYWNFLDREARIRKIDLYIKRKQYVKALESTKSLKMISYTPQDIAFCYNKYAFIFNNLKDMKAAYALYKLSISLYNDTNVSNIIATYEGLDPNLSKMSNEEIIQIATDNEIEIGPNQKILNAQREVVKDCIQAGELKMAKILLENDYAMTSDDEIANVYNQIIDLENRLSESKKEETTQEEDTNEETNSSKPKTKKTTASKAKKTATKNKSTAKSSKAKVKEA